MTIDDILTNFDDLSADQISDLKAALAPEEPKESVPAKPVGKVKCKVCGFHKKPKRGLVETGVCKPCTDAISDGGDVEVVGRMGKRGRNTVSVVIDGQRFRVRRLSSKHADRVAAKHASKARGHAKRSKRTGNAPQGLPTCSRVGEDRNRHEV
jgi:hypothetical protein